MIFWIILIFSLILLALGCYLGYLKYKFSYFTRRNVPGPKPEYPHYGNIKKSVLRLRHIAYDIDEVFQDSVSKYPAVGFFMGLAPYLLIIDCGLLKQILIQKFKYFRNNDFTAEKVDKLISRNPFVLKDDEWKQVRGHSAPALTTNKLKSVHPQVLRGASNMINFIISKRSDKFNVRDLCSRYTSDVTAGSIFSIDANSFTENSEIHALGTRMLKGITLKSQNLSSRWIPEKEENEFIKLVNDMIELRNSSTAVYDDFLSNIISVKNKKNQSDDEAAAHGWTFFLDSFETSGIVAYHALHELARNQRVQNKLRDEIKQNLDESGKITFECLHELEYLDQVFFEVLRLNPPLTFTTKVCSEDVELETSKGEKYKMLQGTTALVSIYSIHRNPEIYSQPDVFHPERFDGGRVKVFRDLCYLLPFGEGPRMCLGVKFGTLIVKTMLVEILKKFQISTCPETPKIKRIDVNEFLNVLEGEMILEFKSL